jgi:3-oxoacyl-[acyl-carrier protein] reductase
MKLKNKVALVTGSSRGIGKAIAIKLAEDGAQVVVHGPPGAKEMSATVEAIKAVRKESIQIEADLSDSRAIAAMFEKIKTDLGRLDILVNNAAFQNPSHILDLKEKDWDYVMDVNLKAPFLCGQYAGRMMREQNAGKIVNISSVHAYDVRRNYAHYSCSKSGLEALTKCMAMELAAFNIQVNTVVPGAIATEMTPAERCESMLDSIPAGRVGNTSEIAQLVAFICSDGCDYLTGTSIRVDGGLTLGFCASRPDL